MLVLKQKGQGLTEYIILIAVVVIGLILAVRYYGSDVLDAYEDAASDVRLLGHKQNNNSSFGDSAASSHETETLVHNEAIDNSDSTGRSGIVSDEASSQRQMQLRAKRAGSSNATGFEDFKVDWMNVGIWAGVIFCLGLTVIFAGAKKKRKKKDNDAARNEDGQAMVEFLFVSITFLFVILGLIQLAMCLNAYALVRYAAYNAARAGIVHASDPGEMKYYMDDAARMSLLAIFPHHGRANHMRGVAENYLAAKSTDNNPALTFFNKPITEVELVHAPSQEINFDDPTTAKEAYITVKVKHQYELVMPLVNRILFWAYLKFKRAKVDGYQQESLLRLARVTDKERRTGELNDIEYRLPIIAHYTMYLQSDYKP